MSAQWYHWLVYSICIPRVTVEWLWVLNSTSYMYLLHAFFTVLLHIVDYWYVNSFETSFKINETNFCVTFRLVCSNLHQKHVYTQEIQNTSHIMLHSPAQNVTSELIILYIHCYVKLAPSEVTQQKHDMIIYNCVC